MAPGVRVVRLQAGAGPVAQVVRTVRAAEAAAAEEVDLADLAVPAALLVADVAALPTGTSQMLRWGMVPRDSI